MARQAQDYEISTALRLYVQRPDAYRIFVCYYDNPLTRLEVSRKVADNMSGKYIDFLQDKARVLDPTIGQYSPEHFMRDLERWSESLDSVLVVDNLEPLFDTWGTQTLKEFYMMIAHLRTDSVILLSTFIPMDYRSLLGSDRVFEVK